MELEIYGITEKGTEFSMAHYKSKWQNKFFSNKVSFLRKITSKINWIRIHLTNVTEELKGYNILET